MTAARRFPPSSAKTGWEEKGKFDGVKQIGRLRGSEQHL